MSELQPITSNRELKTALEHFFQYKAQLQEANDEIKREKAKIWAPVARFKKEADNLEKVIEAYMIEKNLTRLQCNGKIFTLDREIKQAKPSLKDMAKILVDNNIIDDADFILNTRVERVKQKLTYEVPPDNLDEIL